MAGEFIGIGVGPGDPELLTVKAVKALQRCDLLALPVKDKEQCYAYQIQCHRFVINHVSAWIFPCAKMYPFWMQK